MVLAVAKPNRKYVHYKNLMHMTIELRQAGSRKIFYEVLPNKETAISRDIVLSLFDESHRISKRPFLKKENKAFYKLLKNPA